MFRFAETVCPRFVMVILIFLRLRMHVTEQS